MKAKQKIREGENVIVTCWPKDGQRYRLCRVSKDTRTGWVADHKHNMLQEVHMRYLEREPIKPFVPSKEDQKAHKEMVKANKIRALEAASMFEQIAGELLDHGFARLEELPQPDQSWWMDMFFPPQKTDSMEECTREQAKEIMALSLLLFAAIRRAQMAVES